MPAIAPESCPFSLFRNARSPTIKADLFRNRNEQADDDRSIRILWDFRDLCCDGPNVADAFGKAKAGKPVKGKVKASATVEMTDAELAAKLKVNRTTIWRWKRAGTLEAKMQHLANTVNAPSSAQKLGRNLVGLGTNGGGSGGRPEDGDPLAPLIPHADKTPSPALGDMSDPETRRFWRERAARIAAGGD